MNRREFLKGVGAFVAGLAMGATKVEAKAPVYDLSEGESESLKWEKIGCACVDGLEEGFQNSWPIEDIERMQAELREVLPMEGRETVGGVSGITIELGQNPNTDISVGRIIWVSRDGDDRNAGTSNRNAKQTVAGALAELQSGDELVVRSDCDDFDLIRENPHAGWRDLKVVGLPARVEMNHCDETSEYAGPFLQSDDDFVRHSDGSIDVIGTIKMRLYRARR